MTSLSLRSFPCSQDRVQTFSPLLVSTFPPNSTFVQKQYQVEKLLVSLRGDAFLPAKSHHFLCWEARARHPYEWLQCLTEL